MHGLRPKSPAVQGGLAPPVELLRGALEAAGGQPPDVQDLAPQLAGEGGDRPGGQVQIVPQAPSEGVGVRPEVVHVPEELVLHHGAARPDLHPQRLQPLGLRQGAPLDHQELGLPQTHLVPGRGHGLGKPEGAGPPDVSQRLLDHPLQTRAPAGRPAREAELRRGALLPLHPHRREAERGMDAEVIKPPTVVRYSSPPLSQALITAL